MPRQVRIYLGTPLAVNASKPPAPIMFDGLLGYAKMLKEGYTKTPSEQNPANLKFFELPLEKIGEKCYAASAMFLPSSAVMLPTVVIKPADWKFPMAKHAPTTTYEKSVGWQQACMEPYWELATPYIDFYFKGDPKGVADLLSIIYKGRYIGPKRAAGYGLIRRIELRRNVEDWSVWRNGLPTRPVPVAIAGEKPGLKAEWTTYHAPYWATANNAWCYTPPVEQWVATQKASELRNVLSSYFAEKNEQLRKKKVQNK